MYAGVRGRPALDPLPPVPEPEVDMVLDGESCEDEGRALVACWLDVCKAQHAFSERLRRFDLVNAHASDGALSVAAWLRHRCNMTHAQAREQVTVARQLEELPLMNGAYADGEISYQHSAVIAACARKVGLDVMADQEQVLVRAARDLDPFRLRLVCQHLEHMVDQDGSLTFFERQHDRRRLEMNRTADGMWVLRGLLDGEGGSIVATGLEKLMGPPSPDDERPGWQRRADAMVEAFVGRSPSAQLTVIAELPTLQGLRGAPGGELRDGLMVPAATVQRIACDCGYEVAKILDDGVHVDLSASTRTVPPRLRRMVELRDRHCRFPGCNALPDHCDVHHLVWVVHGGKTVLCNLVLLCRRHHRYPHELGWKLMWGETGELLALPP